MCREESWGIISVDCSTIEGPDHVSRPKHAPSLPCAMGEVPDDALAIFVVEPLGSDGDVNIKPLEVWKRVVVRE